MHYYIFDVMVLAGRDLTGDTLDARRQLLEQTVVPTLNEPVRYTGALSAARTRNGFTPALRQQLFTRLRPLETSECPFANLPEAKSGRWGQGLTKAKMAECRWVNPILVGRFEFVEWTPDNHLRHSTFIGLRDDTSPRDVRRE